jgi:hypothetical protein
MHRVPRKDGSEQTAQEDADQIAEKDADQIAEKDAGPTAQEDSDQTSQAARRPNQPKADRGPRTVNRGP